MPYVVIALGANLSGNWGRPDHTIRRAVKELSVAGLTQINCSPLYHTLPRGGGLQAYYHNVVLVGVTNSLPNALLHNVKLIEIEAGRKLGRHWAARVLDIDIIDYNGWIVGWPPAENRLSGLNQGRRQRGSLILPHPQAHSRSFVLKPLRDVEPHWVHRPLGRSLSQLIARLPPGRDIKPLDLPPIDTQG